MPSFRNSVSHKSLHKARTIKRKKVIRQHLSRGYDADKFLQQFAETTSRLDLSEDGDENNYVHLCQVIPIFLDALVIRDEEEDEPSPTLAAMAPAGPAPVVTCPLLREAGCLGCRAAQRG